MQDKNSGARIACAHAEGPGHDCFYVNARNALIPRATELASNRVHIERFDRGNGPGMAWTRAFIAAMDELAAASGLCRSRAVASRKAAA